MKFKNPFANNTKMNTSVAMTKARRSFAPAALRRWPVSVGLGVVVIAAIFFLFTRPAVNDLADARLELESVQLQTAALQAETVKGAELSQANIADSAAAVEDFDRLLPYAPVDIAASDVSQLLLDVPARIKDLPVQALVDAGCDAEQLLILEFANASDVSVGALQVPGLEAGYVAYRMHYRIPNSACPNEPDASSAAFASIDAVNTLRPLATVESLQIAVPAPEPGEVVQGSEEIGYTVEMLVHVHLSQAEGLAQLVPRPLPVADLPGFLLTPGSDGTLSPGTTTYRSTDSSNPSSVTFRLVYPGDADLSQSAVVVRVPVNEQWGVQLPGGSDTIAISVDITGTVNETPEQLVSSLTAFRLMPYTAMPADVTAAANS